MYSLGWRQSEYKCRAVKVTLDISGSPIDFQWDSRKYSGQPWQVWSDLRVANEVAVPGTDHYHISMVWLGAKLPSTLTPKWLALVLNTAPGSPHSELLSQHNRVVRTAASRPHPPTRYQITPRWQTGAIFSSSPILSKHACIFCGYLIAILIGTSMAGDCLEHNIPLKML